VRRLALLTALAALVAGCEGIGRDEPTPPGSTLLATVVDRDDDGDLERGPGEPLVDRTELAPRGKATREIARFGQLTDTHVRDEESPARVPFLDRLGPPVTSTFRPQEALSPQVLAAAVRSLNAERPSAVFITGDLVDSAQAGELTQFLGVLAGRQVDPDTGARGYRGVQQAGNPDGSFYRPALDEPRIDDMLTRAATEFLSPGLRAPWYAALGNHDALVQGELPPSRATDAIASGNRMLQTFDPAIRDLVDRLPRRDDAPETPDLRGVPLDAIERLLAGGVPGDAKRVPPDPARRHLRNGELLERLRSATGVASSGPRLSYAIVTAGVRAIVLDTVDRAGGADGVLDAAQARFLERELGRAGDVPVVVVSHHGLDRVGGPGAARARAALDRSADVVAELAGDTHRNEIEPVRTRAGGYWRITTSSLADWPMQGRMLRIVEGDGGARAIETWMVDQAGGPGNKDLPGAARELAWVDPQGGRPLGFAGTREDRNARLWLPPRR
jgi:3',5'-cyclic AMP phosphodiesterase CpdA